MTGSILHVVAEISTDRRTVSAATNSCSTTQESCIDPQQKLPSARRRRRTSDTLLAILKMLGVSSASAASVAPEEQGAKDFAKVGAGTLDGR